MKHFRFITLLLIAAIAITTNAEKVKKVTVLQQMGPMFSHFEKPVTDSTTGLSTVKWQSTEDRHVKGRDDQWAKYVISVSSSVIENHFNNVPFGRFRNMPNDITPLYWELTEEDGETVLHCYMKMPAEVVTNFWLASEETGIVDAETGVHYRARRSEPDCWKRYFTFRAPKDSIVDFRIYFPPLPETVNDVYIYGVPNWNLRGDHTVAINRPVSGLRNSPYAPYDIAPEFHKPRLVKPEHDYDKNNSGTWAVYTDVHLIKPATDKTFAIWRTKDATYLARATEQNWMREYFGRGGNNVLLDNNGRQYKLKDVMDAVIRYNNKSNANHGRITIEYILLANFNDNEENAHELARLLKRIPCKINLIPFNPHPDSEFQKPSNNRINHFVKILMSYGFTTVIRKTRGDDIDAACGQLVGDIENKIRRFDRLDPVNNVERV